MKTMLKRAMTCKGLCQRAGATGLVSAVLALPGSTIAGDKTGFYEEPPGLASTQLTEVWQGRAIPDLAGRAANTAV